MRPPTSMPRRPRRARPPSGRGRVALVVGLVVAFVLVTSLRGIAGFYTDYLWFDSLDLSGVWRGILGAKTALALLFTAVFFVLAYANLFIADRVSPRLRLAPSSPEDEMVERYHELVGKRAGLLRTVVSLFLAIVAGASASSQWREWILFTNRVDFGQKDATFSTDIGFYVFQLPFLRYVAGWLFSSLVIITLATLVAHYLNGGIRVQTSGERVTAQVKAHLSVLLGLLSLVRAGQYWLQRYELVFSTRGTVDGATYTDVNVQLTVIYLLIIISLTALVLFMVNIRRRGWVLPVLAVGLWAFVALLAGEAVPAFVQRFRVQPDEPAKEAPYIRHNIAATRDGMGLAEVGLEPFAAEGELSSADLTRNADLVRNIRLWDPKVVVRALQRSQGEGLRDYYSINDVDVDRYTIDGRTTQVNIAVRDLSSDGVPQKSWVAQRLTYTHGYGAVVSPANATTAGGQPVLDVRDVPVKASESAPEISQPRVYIGEGQSGYAIVNTSVREFDYQDDSGGTKVTRYSGADGVPLDSFVRKAAFALRFGDINPVISGNVKAGSRLIMQRDVRERVQTVAPFLSYDSDPYPVLVGGRIVWVIDAYTTTDHFPNAQRADTVDVPADSGLAGSFNYVRNSVKATVDAYDGTIRLYVVDDSDPLVRAYAKAFPELFTDGDEVPADLRAHFRYPEDLFRVQTTMWGRYHLSDPQDFYSRTDEWNVAPDPELRPDAAAVGVATTVANASTNVSNQFADRVDPYYMQLRLPGEEKESFTLLRPFVAASRSNRTRTLTAFLVAKSDPGSYGKLLSYRTPSSRPPAGPQDVVNAINSNSAVSKDVTLLCQQQSKCSTTNLLVIPIEQSLLYVRPLYVESESENSVPQLEKVIVAFQTGGTIEVGLGDTLNDALESLFGAGSGQEPDPTEPTEPGQPTEPDPPSADTAQLAADIVAAFDAADAAYKRGDPVEAATQLKEAERLSRELERRLGSGSGGGPDGGSGSGSTTTTTPTTGPPSTGPPTTAPPATTAPTTAPPTTKAEA